MILIAKEKNSNRKMITPICKEENNMLLDKLNEAQMLIDDKDHQIQILKMKQEDSVKKIMHLEMIFQSSSTRLRSRQSRM